MKRGSIDLSSKTAWLIGADRAAKQDRRGDLRIACPDYLARHLELMAAFGALHTTRAEAIAAMQGRVGRDSRNLRKEA